MDYHDYLTRGFRELRETVELLEATTGPLLIETARLITNVFRAHHRLFLFGNGGSAADAQHIAAEFINRFECERAPLPAVALTTDTSVLTSVSNDRDFREVFLRQLKGLAEPGDIAFGISTSGRSPNVVVALRWAREHGLHTIGWSGADSGEMDVYCDIVLHVPSTKTPRIQECHILTAHLLCGLVERMVVEDDGSEALPFSKTP